MTSARFIVESPFQLLMANEARHQLGLLDDSQLVVLWPSGERERETIRDVLRLVDWPDLVDGGVRSPRNMASRIRFVKELSANPRQMLFAGDYFSPYMRHMLVCQGSGGAWLVDDGLGTTAANGVRLHPDGVYFRPESRTRKRRIALDLLGLKHSGPELLNYFSLFSLEESATERITRNEMSWLRSRLPRSVGFGNPLLLGAPFVDNGVMDEGHYLDLVAKIVEKDPAIEYRPHRFETNRMLERLSRVVNVVSGEATIELVLATSETLPSSIMSFFSSATIPLSRLVGDRIQVGTYALRGSDFLGNWFQAGDGVPTLLAHSDGSLQVEAIPGRERSELSCYGQNLSM